MISAPTKSAYDVVVIGAGVIGLSCAWRAAQKGLSVLVAERREPGAGASGVAAGMLAPVTEADFGESELLRANLASARAWPGFAAELEERSGLSAGYVDSGALVVAVDRDDADELRRLHAFQTSLGLKAEWLGARECRSLEPGLSPRIAGGVLAPHDNQADPRATVAALTRALENAGGELISGAEVTRVETDGGRVTAVEGGSRRIACDAVLVAAGPWSGAIDGIPDDVRPPVRPVKGQILRLAAPAGEPVAERLVRTPRCYVVQRANGEVVLGATQEERGFDTRVTADGVLTLLEAAVEALPDVAELEFSEAAARLRPGSPDNAPVIGAYGPDGLFWATGHHRNGVLLAPLTAETIAGLLSGGDGGEAAAAFSPARFAGVPA